MRIVSKIISILEKLLVYSFHDSSYIFEVYNVNLARKRGVTVGNHCRFISISAGTFSTEPYLIEIGNHVSVTNPTFITHDGAVWIFRNEHPEIDLFGKIKIGNNVFVGYGVTFLPGSEIGDNSIVAAGAVVKGLFPGGTVIGGVPAKVICSIADYFEKNKHRFTHFRNSSPQDKKRKILDALERCTK